MLILLQYYSWPVLIITINPLEENLSKKNKINWKKVSVRLDVFENKTKKNTSSIKIVKILFLFLQWPIIIDI